MSAVQKLSPTLAKDLGKRLNEWQIDELYKRVPWLNTKLKENSGLPFE